MIKNAVKEHAMASVVDEVVAYRSPPHKLLRFFIRSRDGWKNKCRQRKTALKRMTNRADALRRSREHWKVLAQQRERELEELRCELDAQKTSRWPGN